MKDNLLQWIVLIIAGLFEIGWAVSLKYSEGFTNLKWSLATLVLLLISMVGLGYAIKTLPVGTAYAVWTGVGAVGTTILGMILFKESTEFWRIFFILMIVCGIVGLKFVSK
ncbi:MAG: multidrug efflux SMR transporter [Candidatus Kapaibacterium sp.]|jgi:quaternary ammonium compound-resistance protein SugE|nr:multidrug efflux SMR transporter [Candidatus Kapabacteria bacterium]